jgi:aspartate aminotransferase
VLNYFILSNIVGINMSISFSNRAKHIKPSPTLSISAMAKQLMIEGKDLIDLSIGEPDFDTPEFIKEAAKKALHDGMTKYTPVGGMIELKNAIVQKFERDNDLSYSLKEVMATTGCKQALCNTIMALINPGEEVIIPSPYWVSYPDMVILTEGKPVFVTTEIKNHFKISPAQLKKAITSKTKLLILNSPSNPTGMVYSREELSALAEVLLQHPKIFIISDDIYEHIRWTGKKFVNILNCCPELKSRVLICHGVSKTYAMTGWRIGYCAGTQEIISVMTNIQSQYTSNPNSIAQYAAAVALTGPQGCVKHMCDKYHTRHEIITQGLNRIPGFHCEKSQGAFYVFADISTLLEKQLFKSDIDLAEYLLQEAGVVVIPGSAFGNNKCIRFSYAIDEKHLKEALRRIERAIEKKVS